MILTKGVSITHSGPVKIHDNEGGYEPDGVEVGGMEVAELVAALFDIKKTTKGAEYSYAYEAEQMKLPDVKITIEVIPPTT